MTEVVIHDMIASHMNILCHPLCASIPICISEGDAPRDNDFSLLRTSSAYYSVHKKVGGSMFAFHQMKKHFFLFLDFQGLIEDLRNALSPTKEKTTKAAQRGKTGQRPKRGKKAAGFTSAQSTLFSYLVVSNACAPDQYKDSCNLAFSVAICL
jgi:hypothetical protein